MGADSEGNEALELAEDLEDSEDEDEDGVVMADVMLDVEQAIAEEIAAGIGGRTQPKVPIPTNIVDGDASIMIMAGEELYIALVPPLQSTTHQSAEGVVLNAPLFQQMRPTL